MTAWKTLSRQTAFDAQPFLRIVREAVELPSGQVIDDFWQVELRSFAVVVPVMEDGRVMALRGYRHGPRAEVISLPGGFIDPGETAEQAALRELGEETGLVAGQMFPLGSFVDNGNQRGCRGHYFLAVGCHMDPSVTRDPTETSTPVAMTVDELDRALDAGEFGVIHHVAVWCLARRHPAYPA